jgi:hypothetical protein
MAFDHLTKRHGDGHFAENLDEPISHRMALLIIIACSMAGWALFIAIGTQLLRVVFPR